MCFPLTRPIEVPLRSTRLDSTAPYTRIYLQVSVNKTLQIYSLPFLIVKNVFLLLFPPLCVYLHIKNKNSFHSLLYISLIHHHSLYTPILSSSLPPLTSFILLFSLSICLLTPSLSFFLSLFLSASSHFLYPSPFPYLSTSSHFPYPPPLPFFSIPPHTSPFPLSLPPHPSPLSPSFSPAPIFFLLITQSNGADRGE